MIHMFVFFPDIELKLEISIDADDTNIRLNNETWKVWFMMLIKTLISGNSLRVTFMGFVDLLIIEQLIVAF